MAKIIQPNFIDRAINFLAPKAGAERMRYRYAGEQMKEVVRKYDGASVGRRTAGWHAPHSSAAAEIQQALQFLRNRSRELARNNPYAENAIREIANNVVGTGIIPKAVGLKTGVDKKLKEIWKAWAESTTCDYDGHMNFYGLQNLAMRTAVESGECIIRKHITNEKDMQVPLKLQVLEPDFIDDTKYMLRQEDGGYTLYGIEFNKEHKIIAYWLWDNHPGDSLQYATKSNRILADEIIHLFEKKRPGQFRGVPFGHAAMLRLKDLDDYEDAQLIRQKIAACFTVFVTDNEQGTINGNTAGMLEKVEPGIIEHLPAGKQVTMATPPDAGQNYDPYVKSVLRAVASSYGMDYVTLTGDLTAVNFSSGRMGWLKFHRNVTAWQWNMLVPQMCNPVWTWFVQLSNVLGHVRQLSVPVTWTPPRREMIDPVKEVEGIEKSIRAGITSLQAAIRENGDDPDEILAENLLMAKYNQDNDLMPTTDPRFDAARKMQDTKAQQVVPPVKVK
jgi:lambda family phage portal protein